MKKYLYFGKKLNLILMIFIIISLVFSGCGNKTSKSTVANYKAKSNVTTQVNVEPKNNKEKIYRELQASWPKPPLFQGNPFAAGGIGTAWTFTMEGLYQVIRSTDKIYPRLAEDMPEHQGNKTIVHLRKGVKWNDGQPFTSKDIWAYYMLNNGVFITKFLTDIKTPDDYTVVFEWNDPAPNDKIKTLLIAQDWQATIPYHVYGKFADKAAELLKQARPATTIDKRGPFGLDIQDDQKINDALTKNWQEFQKVNPKFPIGTGPFKVVKVTASDMVLEKRPDYWNAKNVHFDKVMLKMLDMAGQFAMLKAGQVERFYATQPKDILESMLAANKDLLHYQMFDPADMGFVFNIQKPPFNDVKFRRALIYVFDKSKIREVGNYYGKESTGYSIMGMPLTMVNQWVLSEVKDKMTKFIHDPLKAEQLLKEIGWSKGSDGIWRDKNGKVYNFVIGVNSTWLPAANSSEIAAEQLTKFGFPTKLRAVDPTIYYTAAQDKHEYDMSTEWVDVTWAFNIPWWPLSNFYWGAPSKEGNFPIAQSGANKGRLAMVLPGYDGKLVDIDKELKNMFYMSEEDMKKSASNLVWITNENAFGLDYFQNVAGTWFNMRTTRMKHGWPMKDEIQKYDRNMPLPTDPVDIERIAETNLGFAGMQMIVSGEWMPN